MKVTEVPAHTGLAEAVTDTLTGRFELTVMVTALDVAGEPARHGDGLAVITTDITSKLEGIYA